MSQGLKNGIILHIGISDMSKTATKNEIMQELVDQQMNFKVITNKFESTNYANTVNKTRESTLKK